MKYGDNRDLPVKVEEKRKYHKHTKSTVAEFCRRFPGGGDVVDIGARDGYAVELLKAAGYNVIGTELIQGFVDHAQSHGRNVIFDDVTCSKLPDDTFDLIYSRHCIEHCLSATLFLRTCRRILRKDGRLFMTFPLETKQEFYARKNPCLNHMVYFPSKDYFRGIADKMGFTEIEFCRSKKCGIIPDRREVLYVASR